LFHSFILAVSVVSMFYGRENDSVDDSRAATSGHRAVQVDASEQRCSHGARRMRLPRFSSFMIHPTLWLFFFSWHLRRVGVVAVVF
jgi:hypothetical protein